MDVPFDRQFENGELAVGPVATPIPDDIYVPPPSNTPNLNSDVAENSPSQEEWILRAPAEQQYTPGRGGVD